MIFLKSTKGKTYEAKLTEGGYKLYRVDEENERNLLSADGIQIDNQTPYPALISVDKNGIFNSAKHSIPIKFNYAIIDFALRSLCFGLFMIGFLGKLDFWVLQIVVIGPVLFYQAVKKQEKTVLRWQQSYRLHYEESFAIKFELDKLIFELKYNRLFFIIPLIQAGIGTHFNLTPRFDVSVLGQYMIHLGSDVDAHLHGNSVHIEEHMGGALEGHLLFTVGVYYKLFDCW